MKTLKTITLIAAAVLMNAGPGLNNTFASEKPAEPSSATEVRSPAMEQPREEFNELPGIPLEEWMLDHTLFMKGVVTFPEIPLEEWMLVPLCKQLNLKGRHEP